MNFTSIVGLIEDLNEEGFIVKANQEMDAVYVIHAETKVSSKCLFSSSEVRAWAAGFLARHKKGN